MFWANKDGQRVGAQPGNRGECPCCHGTVLAKCGEIVSWHWAHETNDCDPWYEAESAWHRRWKGFFPDDWQEAVIGRHRADIRTPKFILELQASSISSDEIVEREQFYADHGGMLWLLKGADFAENFELRIRDGYFSFRWRWPRQSWWFAKKPIVIDFPAFGLFYIEKIYQHLPCGGWGNELNATEFLNECGLPTPENSAKVYDLALAAAKESGTLSPRIVVPRDRDKEWQELLAMGGGQ